MALTVFLDRDGVVNRYVRPSVLRWSQFEFLPGALAGLRLLNRDGVRVVVVTNKAWIGLKLLSQKRHEAIHERMLEAIEDAGGRIDAIYTCPHTPVAGCDCRKPKTGLLDQAAEELGIDPDAEPCWIVGDNVSDHRAGKAFGCRTVLLSTTHGEGIRKRAEREGEAPDLVAASLEEAVQFILAEGAL